jgi:hypothetical protein
MEYSKTKVEIFEDFDVDGVQGLMNRFLDDNDVEIIDVKPYVADAAFAGMNRKHIWTLVYRIKK